MTNKHTPVFLMLWATMGFAAQCNKNGSPGSTPPAAINEAEIWLTKANQSALLEKQSGVVTGFGTVNNGFPNIDIDENKKYQSIDGFGYTLTGGSAQLINKMNTASKTALLQELFAKDAGSITISYLRISMGASDLDASVFSYNDLPEGQTDSDQLKFSLSPDKDALIPLLKEILAINPAIKIIATPWSAPVWMKDNQNSKGGSLKPEYHDSYATYFVKYIQAMKAEGIMIDAITPQNEPLHPGNNPSMYMTAEQQRDFIKKSLGPAFRTAGLTTRIIVYDHNLDRPDYPAVIYRDAEAAKYVDGAAFHLYAGDVAGMGNLHNDFPEKQLYFTEQWTGAKGSFDGDLQWHVKNVIIGTMRNWSKTALEWNLANDPSYGPHTTGGCTECKGALTINGSSVSRNVSYYIVAHASKFVPPGSVRIESNIAGPVHNVAFLRPDGKKVLIALNEADTPYTVNIRYKNKWAPVTIASKSVMTMVW
ncbi:glucosylceramidase [Niabella sp. CC-SYL272]|uniref:glycoside hydrolase family 30 protein n=1 Tax=Niabella agricola TaxID=2891571 RepID=UPI001F209106|nr:glycoside hydrolase family 30 beta sandwich domain-containing protein [Niabella agricola]MCF3110821.1 glucosylceramidase [Niabella agricola]